jgi:hypothetical protein
MIFGLFMFGTLWFWLLCIAAGITIIYSLEDEDWGGTGATVTLIVLSVILFFFGSKTMFLSIGNFMINNPGSTIMLAIGWIVAGVVWSFAKWHLHLSKYKQEALEGLKDGYNWVSDSKFEVNKGRIIAWMTYWPFSLGWTMLDNPFRRMFNYIYGRVEKIYKSMSDKALADVKAAKQKFQEEQAAAQEARYKEKNKK